MVDHVDPDQVAEGQQGRDPATHYARRVLVTAIKSVIGLLCSIIIIEIYLLYKNLKYRNKRRFKILM